MPRGGGGSREWGLEAGLGTSGLGPRPCRSAPPWADSRSGGQADRPFPTTTVAGMELLTAGPPDRPVGGGEAGLGPEVLVQQPNHAIRRRILVHREAHRGGPDATDSRNALCNIRRDACCVLQLNVKGRLDGRRPVTAPEGLYHAPRSPSPVTGCGPLGSRYRS